MSINDSSAYICRIGYGDSPTAPGSYVELSSNDPAGLVQLNDPPFVWEDEAENYTFTRKGARQGNHPTSILLNNAKLTIALDVQASDPNALLTKLDQINFFLTQARYRPVVVTIRLPGQDRTVYADVVAGQHIGALNAGLSDATWLANLGKSLKVVLLCLPQTRDSRRHLDNRIINGDFANSIATTTDAGGVDGWTFDSGWALAASGGFYGPTCMTYTGAAASSAGTRALTSTAITFPVGTQVFASVMLMGRGANSYPVSVLLQKQVSGAWQTVTDFGQANVAQTWQQVAATYTVEAGVSALRLMTVCDAREASSFSLVIDGAAIWVGASRLPTEYLAIPGNMVNPARIYGVQGTEAALFSAAITPTATTVPGLIVASVNPHEAGGLYGSRGGMPAITDVPLRWCYIGGHVTTIAPGGMRLDIAASTDPNERRYLFWASIAAYDTTTPNTPGILGASAATVLVTGNGGAQGVVTGPQALTGTLFGTQVHQLVEFGPFALVPPESALATPDLAYRNPAMAVTLRITTSAIGTGNNDRYALDVPRLYTIRSDWGYGWAQITANPITGTPNAGDVAYVLDSTSGVMRVRAALIGNPITANPLVNMTPLRLQAGPGMVNEIGLLLMQQGASDVNATDGYTLALDYAPVRRGGL